MSVLIRVFIPESGTKTQLLYDDLQQIREWAIRHSKPPSHNTVHIYKTRKTHTQCIFLKEALMMFGVWKNVLIH